MDTGQLYLAQTLAACSDRVYGVCGCGVCGCGLGSSVGNPNAIRFPLVDNGRFTFFPLLS